MKTFLISILLVTSLAACKKDSKTSDDDKNNSTGDIPCGDHKSQQLYRDASGNCYYLNSNGEKVMVEEHECSC